MGKPERPSSQLAMAKLLIKYLDESLKGGFRFFRKSDNEELKTTKEILIAITEDMEVNMSPPLPPKFEVRI